MRRFRLSTLMLIVLAALVVALAVQRRAARREAELQARLAEANAVVAERYPLGTLHIQGESMVVKREKENEGAER